LKTRWCPSNAAQDEQEAILKEFSERFQAGEEFDKLPRQHLMPFERADR
jgi:hypothetical protein